MLVGSVSCGYALSRNSAHGGCGYALSKNRARVDVKGKGSSDGQEY